MENLNTNRKAINPDEKVTLAVEVVKWGMVRFTADVMDLIPHAQGGFDVSLIAKGIVFDKSKMEIEQIEDGRYFVVLTIAQMFYLGLRPVDKFALTIWQRLSFKKTQDAYNEKMKAAIHTAPEPKTEKKDGIPL